MKYTVTYKAASVTVEAPGPVQAAVRAAEQLHNLLDDAPWPLTLTVKWADHPIGDPLLVPYDLVHVDRVITFKGSLYR